MRERDGFKTERGLQERLHGRGIRWAIPHLEAERSHSGEESQILRSTLDGGCIRDDEDKWKRTIDNYHVIDLEGGGELSTDVLLLELST